MLKMSQNDCVAWQRYAKNMPCFACELNLHFCFIVKIAYLKVSASQKQSTPFPSFLTDTPEARNNQKE